MAVHPLERPEERLRPRYARVGVLGLALVTAALVIFGVVSALQLPEELSFILSVLAAAALTTVVVWRFEATWAHVVGIVMSLALAVTLFWVAFGLMHPTSFFDFVPAVMFVVGIVLALFGNIAALVQRRAHHLAGHAAAGERHVEQFAIGIVVLAVLASGAASLMGGSSVDEAAAAGAVPVEMSGFAFEPTSIEVSGGGQLLVHNDDAFMHDLSVPALGIDPINVAPGSEVLVDVPTGPGTYVVYCSLHSDVSDPAPDTEENMAATLLVR